MDTYEKVGDSLKVTKEVEVNQEEKTYDYDFLKQQEINILKQINDFVDARKKELEEVRMLLAKSEELGIKSSLEIETARTLEFNKTDGFIGTAGGIDPAEKLEVITPEK